MRQWKSTDMSDTGNTTGDRETAQNRMAARQRWNLMRYLAGGGIAAFTRSVEEEKAEARQDRFLAAAAAIAAAWLVFLLV